VAAAAKEEQVALGLQRRGRHVVERAASKGAWSLVFEFSRAVPVYRGRAATRRGKSVRNCCALNSLSTVARRRGEHEAESVWLPWHVGPQRHGTGAHVLVYRDLPSDATWPLLASLAPHMLPGWRLPLTERTASLPRWH